MSIVILHISDIHIRAASDPILKKSSAIAAALNGKVSNASLVVIAVTGDIAFSGEIIQYKAAEKFIREIKSSIARETRSPIRVLIAPGNHDCNFSKCNNSRRNNISALTSGADAQIDQSVINSCTRVQEEFFKFRERLENSDFTVDDRLWRSVEIKIKEKLVIFEVLNVAWVSRLKEQPNLFFPIERYEERLSTPVDTRITLLHHPFNWYGINRYRLMRAALRRSSSLILSGHEHEGNAGVVDDQESSKSAFVEGCVLQHDTGDLSGTGFNVIEADLETRQFSCVSFRYLKGAYMAEDSGPWQEFHELPQATEPELAIIPGFQKSLSDPGAYFASNRENLSLSDIYVYPDLRGIGETAEKRKFLNARVLRDPKEIMGGVIVQGDDRSGCTSLLRELFSTYLSAGFCPILISGSQIKRYSIKDLEGLLKRARKDQYTAESQIAVEQMSKDRRILFIDDFDECPLESANARASVISIFKEKFDYLIITVNKIFEVKEILEREGGGVLADMKHFEIQPFGFKKRGELIERWFSATNEPGVISEGAIIAQSDRVERIFNAAMDKSIIPSVPLYLLTLLQSIATGRSDEIKESALGHYYHFLITHAFHAAGLPNGKWNELFDYISNLAWQFHCLGRPELTHVELKDFNKAFSDEYTTVDFESRINLLLRARIIHQVGAGYQFRYPYMYYYLKGMHLNKNLNDSAVREYIEKCCKHLYVRDHANTVLFLAHHANDEWLLDTIGAELSALFSDTPELKFDTDIKKVELLISNAPKLSFDDSSDPAKERAKRNQMRDEHEVSDGLLDREEGVEPVSFSAKLAMLFKTIEILGQVVKNQHSSIKRARRRNFLAELLKGPLRALGIIYRLYEQDPDQFIDRISKALEQRGHTSSGESAARRLIASLFIGITSGVLIRTAKNTSSDELLEDVAAIADQDKSIGFLLMELSGLLDSAKDLPRIQIKRILDESNCSLLVERTVCVLVLNRMYMFKTTRSDMHWVRDVLKISLGRQGQIVYQNPGSKLL